MVSSISGWFAILSWWYRQLASDFVILKVKPFCFDDYLISLNCRKGDVIFTNDVEERGEKRKEEKLTEEMDDEGGSKKK